MFVLSRARSAGYYATRYATIYTSTASLYKAHREREILNSRGSQKVRPHDPDPLGQGTSSSRDLPEELHHDHDLVQRLQFRESRRRQHMMILAHGSNPLGIMSWAPGIRTCEISGNGSPGRPPNDLNGPSCSVSLSMPIQTTQPLGFSASARPTDTLPLAWVFNWT